MNWNKDTWTGEDYKKLVAYLWAERDEEYAVFNKRTNPGDFEMIGVRMPILRKLAKEIAKGNWREYLKCKKNSRCHEEIMLEGLVIGELKLDYEEAVGLMWEFAGRAFNWAITDCFVNDRFLRKYIERFYSEELDRYLTAGDIWRVRVGLLVMMTYYLTPEHVPAVLERLKGLNSHEYYVEMMMAWLIATAMAKEREATVQFMQGLSEGELSANVRKFAAQKIRDSYRVSRADKILATKLLQKR